MATWYVNSAAAGTAAGTSWTNACTTMAAAIALSAAGDDFNILNTSAETGAVALSLTFKGTAAAPNRVFSCGNTNSPAQGTDLLAGASIATTSTSTITVSGWVYFYGITISSGSGTGASILQLANTAGSQQFYDLCTLVILSTNSASTLNIGNNASNVPSEVTLRNTTVQFGNAASGINTLGGRFYWRNTVGAIAGAILPSSLFLANGTTKTSLIICDGVDFSALSAKTLVGASNQTSVFQFVNCRLPTSITVAGNPSSGAGGPVVDLINCDSGATGYRQERYLYQGTLTASTTVALSGGASDGVQAIAWKVITTANAKRQSPFETFQIAQWWGAGLGSSHTATFQVLGPAALTSADIWVDAEYLGNSSFPIASLASSAPATQLTAGSALSTAGAGSWSGSTGLTAYTIAVSFTPQLAGYVRFVLKLAKVSSTIYIDPDPQIA